MGGSVLGIAVFSLMVAELPHVARDRAELILSLLGASTMFLLMMLGLTLSIRVQRASSEGKLCARFSGEYLSYAACFVLVILGPRMLPTLGLVSVGGVEGRPDAPRFDLHRDTLIRHADQLGAPPSYRSRTSIRGHTLPPGLPRGASWPCPARLDVHGGRHGARKGPGASHPRGPSSGMPHPPAAITHRVSPSASPG